MIDFAFMGKTNKICDFFISANGGDGFRSYQNEILPSDSLDRLYILKGGPGTGKSSFIKKAVALASESSAFCVRFRCSSDPNSLDAVYINGNGKRIAIIDGTAPHTRDTVIPGATDSLIDLGNFWNSEELSPLKADIISLSAKKKAAYAKAYRYLAGARKASDDIAEIYRSSLLGDKLRRSAAIFLRDIPISKHVREERLFVSSYGMTGKAYLDTLSDIAERMVALRGSDETCNEYMHLCSDMLRGRSSVIRAESPLCRDRLEGLLTTDSSTAFIPEKNIPEISAHKTVKTVNTERFFDMPLVKSAKRELKMLREVVRS